MAEKTAIAWCDHTLNFWEGCTKISPGCDRCYAAARNHRFSGGANWGPGAPRRERLLRACEEARRLNRKAKEAGARRRVFVNSLSDFFDNEVPDDWRAYALGVMAAATWLDFQVLTKRIGNVCDIIAPWNFWPLPNLWLGITVVNQEEADRDIPKLLRIPARLSFLSMEPLLEPVSLAQFQPFRRVGRSPLYGARGILNNAIGWVICGGESGRGARFFEIAWARSLRDECRAAKVPYFLKQVGACPADETLEADFQVHHRAGADPAEWPNDLRVQEFPA